MYKRIINLFQPKIFFLNNRDYHITKSIFESNIKIISYEANTSKTPITSQLWNERKAKKNLTKYDVEDNDINIKTTKDSRLVVKYNFKNDKKLSDEYIDVFGGILIGKLFEDLDALAGNGM